jgi:magnesium chelatase accessory protein
LSNAREAAALVRGGRLVSLPGLGHLAHEEKPDEVTSVIAEFVNEVL